MEKLLLVVDQQTDFCHSQQLWDIEKEYSIYSVSDLRECPEEEGYDPDEMEDSDWDELWETVDESQYYSFTIKEFEGDDEEWDSYDGEVYNTEN